MRFGKSLTVLLICLTGIGCAAKAELVPLRETVLTRDDGCVGPPEVANHVLIGAQRLAEIVGFLNYCVRSGLLEPKGGVDIVPLPVPDGFECPGVSNSELKTEAVLISEEITTMLGEDLLTCVANAREREETPKTEVRR